MNDGDGGQNGGLVGGFNPSEKYHSNWKSSRWIWWWMWWWMWSILEIVDWGWSFFWISILYYSFCVVVQKTFPINLRHVFVTITSAGNAYIYINDIRWCKLCWTFRDSDHDYDSTRESFFCAVYPTLEVKNLKSKSKIHPKFLRFQPLVFRDTSIWLIWHNLTR